MRDRQSLECSEKTFPNNPKNIRLEDLFISFSYATYFFSKRSPIHKGNYMLQFKCNAIQFMITAHVGDYYMPQFKCHARGQSNLCNRPHFMEGDFWNFTISLPWAMSSKPSPLSVPSMCKIFIFLPSLSPAEPCHGR